MAMFMMMAMVNMDKSTPVGWKIIPSDTNPTPTDTAGRVHNNTLHYNAQKVLVMRGVVVRGVCLTR